jgi:hypothetical protein
MQKVGIRFLMIARLTLRNSCKKSATKSIAWDGVQIRIAHANNMEKKPRKTAKEMALEIIKKASEGKGVTQEARTKYDNLARKIIDGGDDFKDVLKTLEPSEKLTEKNLGVNTNFKKEDNFKDTIIENENAKVEDEAFINFQSGGGEGFTVVGFDRNQMKSGGGEFFEYLQSQLSKEIGEDVFLTNFVILPKGYTKGTGMLLSRERGERRMKMSIVGFTAGNWSTFFQEASEKMGRDVVIRNFQVID